MKMYFEERGQIEDQYAKALEKSDQHYKDFEEKTSLSLCWNNCRNGNNQTAKQHGQLALTCLDIAKALEETSKEIKDVKHKNVAQQKRLLAEKKRRAEIHNACKKRYYEAVKAAELASLNLDAGKSQNLPENKLQKLEKSKAGGLKSVELAHSTYQKSVEELKAAQVEFDTKVADMLHEFEALEKKRLSTLHDQGKRFSNSHDFLKSAIEQIAVFLHEGANAAKIDDDIQAFLKANKTGALPPEHITYQPCVSEVIGHMTDVKVGAGGGDRVPPSSTPSPVLSVPLAPSLPGGAAHVGASSVPAAPSLDGPAPKSSNQKGGGGGGKEEFAKALYDFESAEPDDLPFPTDAMIKLTHCPDADDWWQGEYKGKTGMFPKTYVKKVSEGEAGHHNNASPQKVNPVAGPAPAPDSPKVMNAKCEALYDFDGQDSDDLSFRVGDILIITGELDGWFLGKTLDGSKTGIFPSNYVKIKK